MRINFNTLSVPTRAAKRLKSQLSLKDSTAKEWTAYVLGYRNWHELQEEAGQWQVTALDEDCSPAQLHERRQYQKDRLQECLGREPTLPQDAGASLAIWQPSAARPQEPVSKRRDPADWGKSEEARRFSETLVLVLSGRHVSRSVLDPLLINGIRNTSQQKLIEACSEIGQTLIQSTKTEDKAFARRLFEAASIRGVHSATHNLVITLMLGDGGEPDPKRAAELFQKLLNDLKTPNDVRIAATGGLASALAVGKGRTENPEKAYELWEQMALTGNSEAAFNVALYTDPNSPADLKMQENPGKSAMFYRMAAKQGHVPSASNLGILLHTHKELAEHMLEGYEWLQFAANKGDPTATRYLTEIERAAEKFARSFF